MPNTSEKPRSIMKVIVIILVIVAVGAGAGLYLLKNKMESVVRAEIDKRIAESSQYMDISYGSLDVSLTGVVTLKNVRMLPKNPDGSTAAEETVVDSIVVRSFDRDHEIPHFMDVSFNGMTVPLTAETQGEEAAMILSDLGYEDSYTSSFTANYAYDSAKKRIDVKEFSFSGKDMAEVKIELAASNFTIEDGFLPWLLVGYTETMIESASFTFIDDSIVERAVQNAAEEQGVEPATVRQNAIAGLKQMAGQFAAKPVEDLADALAGTIDNGTPFTISVAPQTPMSVGALQRLAADFRIAEIATELNMSVTTGRK